MSFTEQPDTLEKTLDEFLESQLTNYPKTHLQAFQARLGWSGKPPITLHEAGQRAGVTRERIRQIEIRVKRNIRKSIPPVVEKITVQFPTNGIQLWSGVSRRLVDLGITETEWSIQAARNLMSHCDISQWLFAEGNRDSVVGSARASFIAKFRDIVSMTRRMCRASGAVKIDSVVQEIRDTWPGINLDSLNAHTLRLILQCIADIDFLQDDYCWVTSTPINRVRLVNVCKKMFSVARPLHIDEIERGLERKYSFRNKTGGAIYEGIVPPQNILLELLEKYPNFKVMSNNYVDYIGDLEPSKQLTRPEHVIYLAFQKYGKRVLDRQTVKLFGADQDINMSSLEVEMTYSPIVTKIKQNNWRLVGTEVSAEEVEKLPFKVTNKKFARRLKAKGFLDNGAFRVILTLPRFVHNFVSSVPSEMGGGKLRATFRTESGVTLICKNGAIFGFGKFLSDTGHKEGEFLTLDFYIKERKFQWSIAEQLPDLSFASYIPEEE